MFFEGWPIISANLYLSVVQCQEISNGASFIIMNVASLHVCHHLTQEDQWLLVPSGCVMSSQRRL